jgi:mannitol/fructose-specific phosphotransferase system IIA component (Ntr-type)
LTGRTVRARVAVASWRDAVDQAGQLLVDAGLVEPRYVAAMGRVLSEMGPYAVIAPGIVLLHARPEDGVLQPCLALLTLSTPVPFGHSENDPVDLVLALGAVDKQAHVAALRELALLLGDDTTLARIRAAADDVALLSAIRHGRPDC